MENIRNENYREPLRTYVKRFNLAIEYFCEEMIWEKSKRKWEGWQEEFSCQGREIVLIVEVNMDKSV